MSSKIESYGCNPGLMENARKKIDDSCFNGSLRIGIIVEECQTGEGITVHETSVSANMRIDFAVAPSWVGAPDRPPVSVELRTGSTDRFDGPVVDNGAFDLQAVGQSSWTGEVTNETTLSVRVIEQGNPEAEVTVGSSQVFIRTAEDYWTNYPFRRVELGVTDDGLAVLDFIGFQ